MSRYVFIESRDPFESKDTRFIEETAVAVKERGHEVTVFLVQNGVLAARTRAQRLGRLAEAGVTVFAVRDDLEERGLDPSNCVSGVKLIRRNDVALLFDDYNHVWHW